jgi:hypothetical protein
MKDRQMDRFSKNYEWFDQLFAGLESLYDKIGNALIAAELTTGNTHRAVEYNRSRPVMPKYYARSWRGKTYVIQIYAVLNPTKLGIQNVFNNNRSPSFIVVMHSRADRLGWYGGYGDQIIRFEQHKQTRVSQRVSGTISDGDGKGTRFHAFQLPLSTFVDGQNIEKAIQTQIVDKLKKLPKL